MRWRLALLVLAACKSHETKSEGSGSAVAVVPPDDAACLAALQKAPSLTPVRRISVILDACRPCGDWKPILDWSVPGKDGGPTRQALDAAMQACHAYCTTDAKQHFLGTLDDARGTDSRTPWRLLGDTCKAAVSAVPDTRFASAPLFALDRVARYAGASEKLRGALAGITVPLPAVGIGGIGMVLPTSNVITPKVAAILSVSQTDLHLGALPTGTLTADGVTVTDSYPGDAIALADLPAALDKLPDPVALLAPAQMPAERIREVLLAANGHGHLLLAVAAPGGPRGWQLPGVVPIELHGAHLTEIAHRMYLGPNADEAVASVKAHAPDIASFPLAMELQTGATVQGLATALGALGYYQVRAVTLVSEPARPPAP